MTCNTQVISNPENPLLMQFYDFWMPGWSWWGFLAGTVMTVPMMCCTRQPHVVALAEVNFGRL